MTIPEMITAVQRARGVTPDGCAGPETWSAIYRALVPASAATPPPAAKPSIADITAVDDRSEKNIQTLLPPVRPLARSLVHMAEAQGIKAIITGGSRTFEEQAELRRLYLAGKGGKAAPAGFSNHNFGLAFDVTIFSGSKPVWESPNYRALGAIGKSLGLHWGGSWTGKDEDQPHFELRPAWAAGLSESAMVAQLRERQAQGREVFA